MRYQVWPYEVTLSFHERDDLGTVQVYHKMTGENWQFDAVSLRRFVEQAAQVEVEVIPYPMGDTIRLSVPQPFGYTFTLMLFGADELAEGE
jgi:hypothetical protein